MELAIGGRAKLEVTKWLGEGGEGEGDKRATFEFGIRHLVYFAGTMLHVWGEILLVVVMHK